MANTIRSKIKDETMKARQKIKGETRIEYLLHKFGRDVIDFDEAIYFYYLRGSDRIRISIRATGSNEDEKRYFVDSRKLLYEDLYGVTWEARPQQDYINDESVTYIGEATNNGVTIRFELSNAPVPPSCTKVFKGFVETRVAQYEVICNETGAAI